MGGFLRKFQWVIFQGLHRKKNGFLRIFSYVFMTSFVSVFPGTSQEKELIFKTIFQSLISDFYFLFLYQIKSRGFLIFFLGPTFLSRCRFLKNIFLQTFWYKFLRIFSRPFFNIFSNTIEYFSLELLYKRICLNISHNN